MVIFRHDSFNWYIYTVVCHFDAIEAIACKEIEKREEREDDDDSEELETELEEGFGPAGLGEEGTTSLRLKTRLIKQYRAFTVSLYDKYPRIEYSPSKDAIFCYYWQHFAKDRNEPTIVSEGFRNCKKYFETERGDNKLLQHNASFQHPECIDAHTR